MPFWAALLGSVLAAGPCRALGPADWDLELDPYYSALGVTLPFAEGADSADVEKEELGTYRDMLARGFVPRYLVLEASLNPLPLAGVGIRDAFPGFYEDMQFTRNLNLVKAVTAGFEEPWAGAIFLGKVIDFDRGAKRLGRSRKGYVGYLASAGTHHILENLLIEEGWVELEWKVKGDLETEARKMSWSFRIGAKLHDHPEIENLLYVGLRRNRVDFQKAPWSFLLSSAVEYRMGLRASDLKPMSHFLLIEKNVPIPGKRWTFSVGAGYLWQAEDRYAGNLASKRRVLEQIVFRPNLRF